MATVSGRARAAMGPALTFQGRPRPEPRSKPTISTDSRPPAGFFQLAKRTMRRSARATPGTPRIWWNLWVGRGWVTSKLRTPREATQTSAPVLSMTQVVAWVKPTNSPPWTAMSTTAKTTPVSVTARRTRSCRRFRSAMRMVMAKGRLFHVPAPRRYRIRVAP